jgi:hydroxyethylthiazole kinase
MALAARAGSTKGVDSTVSSTNALETAKEFAAARGVVISLSGATDYITDGTRVLEVQNGSPLMTRVTGLGCTASALTGAFCAVNPDPLVAAAHAMAVMGICGELAAAGADGPGTLQTRFLDRLYTLNEREIRETLQ